MKKIIFILSFLLTTVSFAQKDKFISQKSLQLKAVEFDIIKFDSVETISTKEALVVALVDTTSLMDVEVIKNKITIYSPMKQVYTLENGAKDYTETRDIENAGKVRYWIVKDLFGQFCTLGFCKIEKQKNMYVVVIIYSDFYWYYILEKR